MAVRAQEESRGPVVSGSSIVAAGLASALAAAVTSSMGWAGGLIGAALTTMIITGGSAILNAYIQGAKSRVQAAPGSLRNAAQRVRSQGQGAVSPRDSGAGEGFVDRLRGALGWFSRLPAHRRSSILKRGMIGAAAAFVIGILSITAIEYGIGNSLSCGIWGNCPATSAPGFGGGGAYTASGGGGYSILAGRSAGGGVSQPAAYDQQTPVPQESGGGLFGNDQQTPVPQQDGGGLFGGGQQTPVPQQPAPVQPAPAEPVQPAEPVPAEPAVPAVPAVPAE